MRKQYIQPQSGPDAGSQGNPVINHSRRYRGDWEDEEDEEDF